MITGIANPLKNIVFCHRLSIICTPFKFTIKNPSVSYLSKSSKSFPAYLHYLHYLPYRIIRPLYTALFTRTHDYLLLTIARATKNIYRKMVMKWLRFLPCCYETATDIISSYPLLFHIASVYTCELVLRIPYYRDTLADAIIIL